MKQYKICLSLIHIQMCIRDREYITGISMQKPIVQKIVKCTFEKDYTDCDIDYKVGDQMASSSDAVEAITLTGKEVSASIDAYLFDALYSVDGIFTKGNQMEASIAVSYTHLMIANPGVETYDNGIANFSALYQLTYYKKGAFE